MIAGIIRWTSVVPLVMALASTELAAARDVEADLQKEQGSAAANVAVKAKFVGVWTLLSSVTTTADGKVSNHYGDKPSGRITYDSSGRMSALLMGADRKKVSSLHLRNATESESKAVLQSFTAYYGRFDVNEANKTVIHHVDASLDPNWVGTDLVRSYEFEGDKLILTAASPTGAKTRLVWQRQKD